MLITPFEADDLLYLGSDGFQNQLGGEKIKKFSSNRLHQFLLENGRLPLTEQFNLLREEWEEWKGMNDQTDDICLFGTRL